MPSWSDTRTLSFVAVLLVVAPTSAGASEQQPAQPKSSCEHCHPDVAKAETLHPHARAGVSCTSCHGGDATKDKREEAEAPAAGFKGKLHGKAIVTLCGDCHADVEKMNPYGLRTDQLAQYRTSGHGKALFGKDDESVATCASCHGAHGILGPSSSESPVYPGNVPATCAHCHSDADLMAKHGLEASIPDEYRKSVHAEALLQKGDLSAPACATCHGSHGAVPPGFRTVGAVCGKCHVRELDLFEKSPHAPLVAQGDFPGCETCHGNHEIKKADTTILERMCDLCHGGEAEPLARRDHILGSLRETRELLASTEASVQKSSRLGLVTDDDRLLLEEAKTALEQAQVQQHALDAKALDETTGEASTTLRELATRLEKERRSQRLRRLAIVPVVGFLLLMSFGFWIRYRRIQGLA